MQILATLLDKSSPKWLAWTTKCLSSQGALVSLNATMPSPGPGISNMPRPRFKSPATIAVRTVPGVMSQPLLSAERLLPIMTRTTNRSERRLAKMLPWSGVPTKIHLSIEIACAARALRIVLINPQTINPP